MNISANWMNEWKFSNSRAIWFRFGKSGNSPIYFPLWVGGAFPLMISWSGFNEFLIRIRDWNTRTHTHTEKKKPKPCFNWLNPVISLFNKHQTSVGCRALNVVGKKVCASIELNQFYKKHSKFSEAWVIKSETWDNCFVFFLLVEFVHSVHWHRALKKIPARYEKGVHCYLWI